METSGTAGTMTVTKTFTPVLPVMEVADRVTIDLSGHAAPMRRQFPVVKANGAKAAKRDNQSDLRPPPRWGLNE